MTIRTIAAITFAILVAFPILAQLALALGAPWGRITMGGRWPGKLPPFARIAALAQAAILFCLGVVALAHGGLLDIAIPSVSIWIVVAVSCISAVLNNITPSRIERRLWGPLTVLMAVTALILAFM